VLQGLLYPGLVVLIFLIGRGRNWELARIVYGMGMRISGGAGVYGRGFGVDMSRAERRAMGCSWRGGGISGLQSAM